MRLANFLSPGTNRAALSITPTLYDRRALDCTGSRPLVQSLQQLVTLTGSSSRVRETLCQDGGLERLVQLMKEAHEQWQDPLMAYRWHLCLQCLLNLGARGTEHVRTRIVEAGVIPVIATILDNYLLTHAEERCSCAGVSAIDHTHNYAARRASEVSARSEASDPQRSETPVRADSLRAESVRAESVRAESIRAESVRAESVRAESVRAESVRAESVRADAVRTEQARGEQPAITGDERARDLALRSGSEDEAAPLTTMANMESFLASRASQEIVPPRALAPEQRAELDQSGMARFVDGVLVPKEQDALWALEIVAFVSKYSHLRREMQDTHILPQLSMRSPEDILRQTRNAFGAPPCTDDECGGCADECGGGTCSSDRNACSSHACGEHACSASADAGGSADGSMDANADGSATMDGSASADAGMGDSACRGARACGGRACGGRACGSEHGEDRSESDSRSTDGRSTDGASCFSAESEGEERKRSDFIEVVLERGAGDAMEVEIESSNPLNTAEMRHLLTQMPLAELEERLQHTTGFEKYLAAARCCAARRLDANAEAYYRYDYENDVDVDIEFMAGSVNLFELVEQFTALRLVREFPHWSCIIMRNFVRKDEGGIRQCANFACGRWEKYPRQFAKCRRCKRTKYCSKSCQLRAWGMHRYWCSPSSSSQSQETS